MNTRTVKCQVNDEYVIGAGVVLGAEGSHDDVILELTFSKLWLGLTKSITWWDALGEHPVRTILTIDTIDRDDPNVYRVPVPAEAKAVAGEMELTIKGAEIEGDLETRATMSVTTKFRILPGKWAADAGEVQDVTPSQAEQIQASIDAVRDGIVSAVEASAAAAVSEANAAASAAAARVSETNAAASEANAAASAAAGRSSETNAAASETNARTSEVNAKASETAAKTSETNAKASETAAKTSETNAKASEEAAKSAAEQAAEEAAKSAAEQAAEEAAQKTDALLADKVAAARKAEANAKASENAAKTSETNAKASETAAKTSEANAKASETAAKAAEKAAKTSESSAASSASSAASSKAAAETAKTKAEAAQAAAEKARNEAEGIVGGDYISRPEAKALVDQGVRSANDYTNRAIAAIPAPDVSGQIQAHNTDGTAHGDIRQAVEDHAGDHNNPHGVTKGQVGLGNVDNTADTDKPVSTAQAAAIADAKNAGQAASALAARVQDEQNIHVDDYSNPHNVTAEQVGAIAAWAVGNLHVWERVQTYSEPVPEVPAGYTLGAVEENVSITNTTSSADTIVMYSATSLTVSNDGTISTSGFGSASGKITSVIDKMYGKFIYFRAQDSDFDSNNIIFIPSDATRSWGDNGEVVVSKLQRVTGYPYTPAIPAVTHVDYLTSTDPNAYPKQSAEGGQDASYVLGDVVSNYDLGQSGSNILVTYSSDIVVSYDGVVTMVEPNSLSMVNIDTDVASTFSGKFVKTSINDSVVFIPVDATASYDNSSGFSHVILSKYQPVTGYPAIPANTVITYLGQLGGGARIEVGSYVGTGTYGSSNPNSLTFEFEPKIIWIAPISYTDISATIRRDTDKGIAIYVATNIYTLTTSWSRNAVTWYSNQALYQLNASGVAYSYIALG